MASASAGAVSLSLYWSAEVLCRSLSGRAKRTLLIRSTMCSYKDAAPYISREKPGPSFLATGVPFAYCATSGRTNGAWGMTRKPLLIPNGQVGDPAFSAWRVSSGMSVWGARGQHWSRVTGSRRQGGVQMEKKAVEANMRAVEPLMSPPVSPVFLLVPRLLLARTDEMAKTRAIQGQMVKRVIMAAPLASILSRAAKSRRATSQLSWRRVGAASD